MQLGNFSISLSVKDIRKSKAFYETLGFKVVGGDIEQNWLIMKNGHSNIGLFQDMFPKNTLTFNPGWSNEGEPLESFEDIRDLQRYLKDHDITIDQEADEGTAPTSFMIKDPDGNPILVDQHVEAPEE